MKFKEEILDCIAENIRDQNDLDFLVAHMGAYNLEKADALEDCKNHIEQLYDILEWTVNMKCGNGKIFYFSDEIKSNLHLFLGFNSFY